MLGSLEAKSVDWSWDCNMFIVAFINYVTIVSIIYVCLSLVMFVPLDILYWLGGLIIMALYMCEGNRNPLKYLLR